MQKLLKYISYIIQVYIIDCKGFDLLHIFREEMKKKLITRDYVGFVSGCVKVTRSLDLVIARNQTRILPDDDPPPWIVIRIDERCRRQSLCRALMIVFPFFRSCNDTRT